MLQTFKLSVSELIDFSKEAREQGTPSGLPLSKPGVADRAIRQNWEYEEVPSRGGKNGVKKVYILPTYIVEELKTKGLLPLLEKFASENTDEKPNIENHQFRLDNKIEVTTDVDAPPIPPTMRAMVEGYSAWSEQQDVTSVVPVRYHTNLFGKAGHGERFDEQLITEAMWFRASFFDVLGVSPDKCFCSRIKGDSMEPTLIDRGTVLWQMTAVYLGEGIYLFRQYDDIRIKRLHRINRYTYRIVSDSSNKDSYPTEILDLSQSQDYDFEIYGKYLWDCGIAS